MHTCLVRSDTLGDVSPKSRGRGSNKHKQTPPRSSGGQKGPPPPKALFRDMLGGARELLAIRNPLDAELFVSEVLGTWWGQRVPEGDVEEVIGEALVDHAARSDDPAALALLLGIAHLGTAGQATKADSAAQRLAANGILRPPWAEQIGRAGYDAVWASRDVYGDQDSLICTYHQPGSPREGAGEEGDEHGIHALVVLLDYNLGGLGGRAGMAKDAWCTSKVGTLLDHCRREADENPLMDFVALDPAYARALLQAALQETDRTSDPPVGKSFPSYHAFVRARLHALPEGGELPDVPAFSADRRAALSVEFLASPEAEALSDTAAAGRCADLIVDHGCDADLGRPLRVSPIKAELFLLDWLPRKVLLRTEDLEAMPHVLTAWVRWCGRKNEMPQAGMSETLDAVWEATRRFEETYGDPSRIGLDTGTVDRLVPDGDLEALPRRAFAVPLLTGEHQGVDLGALDPADADDRSVIVAAEHPEYAELVRDAGMGTATGDGTDPHLHLALHEVVATQLWDGDPAETWQAAQRLLDLGYERHDVLHMLMTAVSRIVYDDLAEGRPYDRAAFRAALDELPGWWENLRPG